MLCAPSAQARPPAARSRATSPAVSPASGPITTTDAPDGIPTRAPSRSPKQSPPARRRAREQRVETAGLARLEQPRSPRELRSLHEDPLQSRGANVEVTDRRVLEHERLPDRDAELDQHRQHRREPIALRNRRREDPGLRRLGGALDAIDPDQGRALADGFDPGGGGGAPAVEGHHGIPGPKSSRRDVAGLVRGERHAVCVAQRFDVYPELAQAGFIPMRLGSR
jgi:hypothetical protein